MTPSTSQGSYTVHTGVALEDLAKDSIILTVSCPDLFPEAPFGTLGTGISTGSTKLQDRDGKPIAAAINTANHIVATWGGKSNQRYPSLIRKGEPVEVFKVGNQDKYFWRETGRGRDFRTTDRVHMEIGATDPSKPGQTKTDDNTYSMWMDSEEKSIGFKSSKANGEACAITVKADLATGTVVISDDSAAPGNRIFLDTGVKSKNPIFQVNLSTGSTIKLEKDDLLIKVKGKFMIDAGDRFIVNTPLFVMNLAQKGAVIINAANIALNAAKDIISTAGSVMGINAASTKIGGVLVAGSARIGNAVKAGAGGAYKPVSVQRPAETPVVEANNSADTSMTGPPYKTT